MELKPTTISVVYNDCIKILSFLDEDTDGDGYGAIYSLGHTHCELPYHMSNEERLKQEQYNCFTILDKIDELKSALRTTIGVGATIEKLDK